MEAMKFRCPTARPISSFMLRDWQLDFYSHATVERKNGASCPGVLWDLTPEDELALDMFEGFPYYYTKTQLVQDGHTFFLYEMSENKMGLPSPGYIDGIKQGYHEWGLPAQALKEALTNANNRTIQSQRKAKFQPRKRNRQALWTD